MYERMLDKEIKPTVDELVEYCGKNGELFLKLNNWLTSIYKTEQSIVFPYGNNYGWSIAHRKKNKLICNIFAEENAFTVMLRLSNKQFDDVYEQLQSYAQDYIDNKYPCGSGGWIHYRVINKEQLKDIQTLLVAKF